MYISAVVTVDSKNDISVDTIKRSISLHQDFSTVVKYGGRVRDWQRIASADLNINNSLYAVFVKQALENLNSEATFDKFYKGLVKTIRARREIDLKALEYRLLVRLKDPSGRFLA